MQVLDFAYDLVLVGSIAYIATSFVRYVVQRSQASSMARKCAAAVQVEQESIAVVLDQWVEPIEVEDEEMDAIVPPAPELVEAAQPEIAIEDVVVPFVRKAKSLEVAIDWSKLTPQQLRQECQKRGIRWRNYHGKNKHLNKAGMVAALNAIANAA